MMNKEQEISDIETIICAALKIENAAQKSEKPQLLYDLASQHYTSALELCANDEERATAYVQRARIHYKLNRFDAALRDWDDATRLNPNEKVDHFYRGLLRIHAKQYAKASEDFEQEMLRPQPLNAFGYAGRGIARKELGQYDEAVSDFTEAIRLYPESPASYAHRAQIYALQFGRIEEARRDLNEAIRLDPIWKEKAKDLCKFLADSA